ncbi:DUF6090 family protein [Poritiphilus flavus]|uniref:Uncharacterized protein n=1 Tax=Poritiphilus flavus TaxID=2697053 RepID=A0A6L9EC02_9FLAO|nr:DUF6090 family protein [Poritiphilus flavus]NAS12173.1 hypothetical protein [Poritiphilus flavus]
MKLFRKIRIDQINKGQLKKYLLYAIGEILLVMIGISLALQVNNWNEARIRKNTEIGHYMNIRDQIVDDKKLISNLIDYNNGYMQQFKFASGLIEANDRSQMDTLGLIVRNLTNYSDFDRHGNIYETMVNSGEVKLLRNHKIVDGLRILEEKYLYINRMENIHYDAMMTYVVSSITPSIRFSDANIVKPENIFSVEFQNLLFSLLQIMAEKDKVYHDALNVIDNITELINVEIAEKM